MTRAEILSIATDIVTKDRATTHGPAENTFKALAVVRKGLDIARAHRTRIIADEALDLAALKLVRAAYNPQHMDNAIDGAAYFAIFGELVLREAE